MTSDPQLAPPGAGLPFPENLIARYFFYPGLMRAFSWAGSLDQLQEESARIQALSAPLSEKEFATRVLIGRLRGLEDSSRFWSAAMTVRHLTITMRGMTAVAETLAAGRDVPFIRGTADVKPESENLPPQAELLDGFMQLAAECRTRLMPLKDTAGDTCTAQHPFFGRIPAKGWVCVLGVHQKLHRVQIERIIKGLPQGS
jgi:hypothetical protein